jgi:hypothetical protein
MDSSAVDGNDGAGVLQQCRQSVVALNEMEEPGDGTLIVSTQYFLPNFEQIEIHVRPNANGSIWADDGGRLADYLEGRATEIAAMVDGDSAKLGVSFIEESITACVDRPEHVASMVVAVAKVVAAVAERLERQRRG